MIVSDYNGTIELTSVSDAIGDEVQFVSVAGIGSDGLGYVRIMRRTPRAPMLHDRSLSWQVVATYRHGSADSYVRNLPGGMEVHSGIA